MAQPLLFTPMQLRDVTLVHHMPAMNSATYVYPAYVNLTTVPSSTVFVEATRFRSALTFTVFSM